MENVAQLVCTVCGEVIVLEKMKENGRFMFHKDNKRYKVFRYECPCCSNITYVSEKFLEEINH